MSTPPLDTTLLALLLTLRKIEGLSQSEQALLFPKLFEVGEQLELDPDDWEFIFEGLVHIINNHGVFQKLFQTTDTHIQAVNIQIQENLLPTEEEIVQVFKFPKNIEVYGNDHILLKLNQLPLLKITVKILKSVNPSIAAKQSHWLNRITKILLPLEP